MALRSLLVCGAAALALIAGAGTAQAIDVPATTDKYLFSISLPQFEQIRGTNANADVLDWSSDGCSWSPDKPLGWNFLPACHRHDFGYRNYKKQNRFGHDTRLRIDDNLKRDLYGICGSNPACRKTADLYYAAVRKFGGP
ncbi:phospholipase [Pseudonocardiaceae bacterium YIM PH 21723]|nr:phospholipase [Pseudonocardiaceae bacterium YIM PH 21723]